MKSLIIGASGLVGGALYRVLRKANIDTIGTARTKPTSALRTLELRNSFEMSALFEEARPDVIFLPAALTNVDYCEVHLEETYAYNVAPLHYISHYCVENHSLLVFYSTDYIFDGTQGPYDENSYVNPINVYGCSKAEAERIIQESGTHYLILRTNVVYGWDRRSKNFAMQLWHQLGSGEPTRVPSDQFGNPTLADFLAEVSLQLVQRNVEGTVNIAGLNRLSRSEFAYALAKTFALPSDLIEPVTTIELGQVAKRPLQAGLRIEKLKNILGCEPITLDEALNRLFHQWHADSYHDMRIEYS